MGASVFASTRTKQAVVLSSVLTESTFFIQNQIPIQVDRLPGISTDEQDLEEEHTAKDFSSITPLVGNFVVVIYKDWDANRLSIVQVGT